MKNVFITILLFIFVINITAYPEENEEKFGGSGDYEISPIFGAMVFEDKSYDNSVIIGLRGLLHLTKKYAIEGEMSYAPTSFRYGVTGGQIIDENLNIFNLNCNFVYKYALSPNIYSYGTAGIGFISFLPKDADSSSDLYFNFGGGLKFSYWKKVALRIDIRQYAPSVDMSFFSPRSGNIFFGPGTSPKADVQKILQLNFGLTFIFR